MSLQADYRSLQHYAGRELGYGRAYQTGTIGSASGVVTLSGGTWPADAASGRRILTGAYDKSVNTRDSDTQLTLNDLTFNLTSGASYLLVRWTDQDLQDLDDCIREALRNFYYPVPTEGGGVHEWSFLKPLYTLTTTAPYTTGTVAISSGVVTLTGGTFPSWAAYGEISVSGGVYDVSTRDSNTQVTLVDTSVTVASGAEYSLRRVGYALPSDFDGIDGLVTYNTAGAFRRPLEVTSHAELRGIRQIGVPSGPPTHIAIYPDAYDLTTGTSWIAELFPSPDAAYPLQFQYRASVNQLSGTNLYPLGGPAHSQTIVAAVLAQAELIANRQPGPRQAEFMARLAASIAHDKQQHQPKTVGEMRDTDWQDYQTTFGLYDVDYGIVGSITYP